MDIDLY